MVSYVERSLVDAFDSSSAGIDNYLDAEFRFENPYIKHCTSNRYLVDYCRGTSKKNKPTRGYIFIQHMK